MTFKPDLTELDTLLITVALSPESLEKVKRKFKTVHYYPADPEDVPADVLAKVQVWYSNYAGFPARVTKAEQVPELKVMQLSSAGSNNALQNPLFKDRQIIKQLALCGASGIHAYSIPQYVIAQIVNLYTFHHIQADFIRGQGKWPSRDEQARASHPEQKNPSGLGIKSMYGKTAGLLGYGAIGREVARLLKAFNVNVIAANSSGRQKKDEGYIVPGTGDEDGSIPSAYYSTTDPKSFKEFLGKSDIVIASLPSTPETRWLLSSELLDSFKEGSVLINVGRGDLVHSDDLLAALSSSSSGLYSAALDVTDPEPLPSHHPLMTHPHVIVTPHCCGEFEGYYDAGADLLIANVEKMRAGGGAMNRVDLERGY